MLSSPPDLSCSENFIKTDLHSTLTTCYSKEVFAYLREAEVLAISLSLTFFQCLLLLYVVRSAGSLRQATCRSNQILLVE